MEDVQLQPVMNGGGGRDEAAIDKKAAECNGHGTAAATIAADAVDPNKSRITRTGTQFNALAYVQRNNREVEDPFEGRLEQDTKFFGLLTGGILLALIIVYAVDLDYVPFTGVAATDSAPIQQYYPQFISVSVMIFFGFGLLMTFLRRYGFSAIGYVLFISSLTVLWSVPLQNWFEAAADERTSNTVGVYELLHGLFCAGAVMISFGVVIGKTTPSQLVVLAVIEAIFFWLNIYCGVMKNHAHDVGGGGVIHLFGGVTGIVATKVLHSEKNRGHKDNASCYSSDLFSLTGTLFLWIMWPSFNAAIADPGAGFHRTITNTILSLIGSTLGSFIVTRFVTEGKFNVVHVQNSTLAGGVMMGVVGDAALHPASALGCGVFIGVVSVLGYQYVTPYLNNNLGIHDTCGVFNLHLTPGFFACVISIIAADRLELGGGGHDKMVGRQFVLLISSIGFGIAAGLVSGLAMKFVANQIGHLSTAELFNDKPLWELPSDYHMVVDVAEEVEEEVKKDT